MTRRRFTKALSYLGLNSLFLGGFSSFAKGKKACRLVDMSRKDKSDAANEKVVGVLSSKSFSYVDKTPQKAKNCANCQFHKKVKGSNDCVICILAQGDNVGVASNGYCNLWQKKKS